MSYLIVDGREKYNNLNFIIRYQLQYAILRMQDWIVLYVNPTYDPYTVMRVRFSVGRPFIENTGIKYYVLGLQGFAKYQIIGEMF